MATDSTGHWLADDISGGGVYKPNDNGVNLEAPQGGDFGYRADLPGAGENYANSALSYYGAGNVPGVTQNTQQAYTNFSNSVPADTSSFYNNAVRNSSNDLNKQMAARGQFGSSNAVGQLSNASTNIRAQQAHDEAQYGLQRAQLGGSLASGADASSLNASRNQLDWTQGLGDMAFRGQAAGQGRFQQNYENTLGMAGVMSGLEGDSYSHEFANDRDLMDSAIDAQTGGVLQHKHNADDQVSKNDAHDKAVLDAGISIFKAAAGAGI